VVRGSEACRRAKRIVGDVDGCVRDERSWRSLTRKGERLRMQRVDEFVWVDHHTEARRAIQPM
jgi:hypothetical protein